MFANVNSFIYSSQRILGYMWGGGWGISKIYKALFYCRVQCLCVYVAVSSERHDISECHNIPYAQFHVYGFVRYVFCLVISSQHANRKTGVNMNNIYRFFLAVTDSFSVRGKEKKQQTMFHSCFWQYWVSCYSIRLQRSQLPSQQRRLRRNQLQ